MIVPPTPPPANPAILVFPGSFSPITVLHIAILRLAIQLLSQTHTVVHTYISPVSDSYQKEGLMPFKQRYEMVKAAVQDMTDVTVSDFENEQTQWTPTWKVIRKMAEDTKKLPQAYLVMGADVLYSFSRQNADGSLVWPDDEITPILTGGGLIVADRSKHTAQELRDYIKDHRILRNFEDSIHITSSTEPGNIHISSTFVRECLKRNEPITGLVDAKVEDLLYEYYPPQKEPESDKM